MHIIQTLTIMRCLQVVIATFVRFNYKKHIVSSVHHHFSFLTLFPILITFTHISTLTKSHLSRNLLKYIVSVDLNTIS
jgi:beta-lactamase regulating signal transducer with metallopeptidase domain